MEFLKALAREAGSNTSLQSDTILCPESPPSCALATPLEALHAGVVMEMLVDELDVLSATVSSAQPDLRSQRSIELDDQWHRPKYTMMPTQKPDFSLVQQYSSVIPRRMMEGLEGIHYWPRERLNDLMTGAKVKTDTSAGKYQMDRTFLHMVADNTLRELLGASSHTSMYRAVLEERTSLKKFWDTCVRLTEDRLKIARLKREKAQVKREARMCAAKLDDEIFKLMDQSLELDKRIQLEANLVQKQVAMTVKRFKRRHRHVIAEHNAIIAVWQRRLTVEFRVHMQMHCYLIKILKERNLQLNYWTEKYEADLTQLTTALEEMQAERYKDTMRARYLETMIARREPVVVDDRRMKALEAEKRKREKREKWASVKIQAWWRGTMVRNELGPFRKVIAKPAKKGAKDEKGGKDGKAKKK